MKEVVITGMVSGDFIRLEDHKSVEHIQDADRSLKIEVFDEILLPPFISREGES